MTFAPTFTGLFGKLPARGDFVRVGLPEEFVAAWDSWCREMLAASRAALGDGWEAAWMQAPIWRFLLPPGPCGPFAVLGVWLPSMDKVGRHFPFLLAALAPSVAALAGGAAWLEAAEAAGLAAVVEDAPHEDIIPLLSRAAAAGVLRPGWWTDGGPYVQPARLEMIGLPPASFAAAMLRDTAAAGAD